MSDYLNKYRNKQIRVKIKYEFVVTYRTIVAAIGASLFFAIAFTIHESLK